MKNKRLRPSGYEPNNPLDFHLNLVQAAGPKPTRPYNPHVLSLVFLLVNHVQSIRSLPPEPFLIMPPHGTIMLNYVLIADLARSKYSLYSSFKALGASIFISPSQSG